MAAPYVAGVVNVPRVENEPILGSLTLRWMKNIGYINSTRVIEMPNPDVLESNSLYHATLEAVFLPYRTGYMRGEEVTTSQLVASLKDSLIQMCNKPADKENSKETIYEILGGGSLAKSAAVQRGCTLEFFKVRLDDVMAGVTPEGDPDLYVIELVARVCNVGIIILDATEQDILTYDEFMFSFTHCIVLIFYRENEYTPFGNHPPFFASLALLAHGDDNTPISKLERFETPSMFSINNPFIKCLRNRITTRNLERAEKNRLLNGE